MSVGVASMTNPQRGEYDLILSNSGHLSVPQRTAYSYAVGR